MGLHSNRLHRWQDLALGTSAEPTQPLPASPPLQLDDSAAPAPPNTPSLEDPSARGPRRVTCPLSMCWGELEPEETGCQQELVPVQPVTQDSVPHLHPHSTAENCYKWPQAQGGFPAHAGNVTIPIRNDHLFSTHVDMAHFIFLHVMQNCPSQEISFHCFYL